MTAPENLDDMDDVDLAALSTRVLHDIVVKMTPEDRQRYRDALDAADAPLRDFLGAALGIPETPSSAPGQKCATCRGAFSGMSWDTLCPSCWEEKLRNEKAARGALASRAAVARTERGSGAMRTYLAGPMTGHLDLNFPLFHAEAKRLRSAGHDVVNPAEINVDPNKGWAECMRADIAELVKCDAIAMLPGWQNSRGATLEHHIATQLDLRVILLPLAVASWTGHC